MIMNAIILMLTLAFAPALHGTKTQVTKGWLTYKGAWFEVRYPSTFKVRPSLPGSSESIFDSVFFTAPDGNAEFYVFSPQWNGDPSDIQIKGNEVLVSKTSDNRGKVTVRRVTVKARDHSYTRSFEDTEDSATNTRKVFGIKYRDQSAYDRYRQTYLTFKQSLRQFAD
jgi:hypothetical protein